MRDLFKKVCKIELKTLPLESGLVLVPDQNVKGGAIKYIHFKLCPYIEIPPYYKDSLGSVFSILQQPMSSFRQHILYG